MSSSPSWSPPPSFNNASRGYWGYEVDRLIDDLRAADQAGEPLTPIIAERKLAEVGFGYDMSEVDAYLAGVAGEAVRPTTSAPKSAEAKTPSPTSYEDRQLLEQPPAAPLEAEYQVMDPYVPGAARRDDGEWNQTWSGAAGAMLAEIHRARMIPAPETNQTGYDAGEVDQFLAHVADMIETNQPITRVVQSCRFRVVPKGTPSYEVSEVDALLDRLEGLSSGAISAPEMTYSMSRSVRMTRTGSLRMWWAPGNRIVLAMVIVAFTLIVILPLFYGVLLPLFAR